jgi:hypothetical protein
MQNQMMVVFDVDGRQPMTVTQAGRIEAELLAVRRKNGRKELAQMTHRSTEPGDITPRVAYQLTETEARFILSGSSGRVQELLSRLINADYGPGTTIALATGDVLVVKTCTTTPQCVPAKATGGEGDGRDAGLNQMLDLALKLTSLAMQGA